MVQSIRKSMGDGLEMDGTMDGAQVKGNERTWPDGLGSRRPVCRVSV